MPQINEMPWSLSLFIFIFIAFLISNNSISTLQFISSRSLTIDYFQLSF